MLREPNEATVFSLYTVWTLSVRSSTRWHAWIPVRGRHGKRSACGRMREHGVPAARLFLQMLHSSLHPTT